MRRRIVIVPLVALLVVVIGGGFIAWQWTQSQYYVGADSKGEVTIYRGVNQRIAGISLSSPYQATGIRLAQVPTPYQQTLEATDAASSLSSARAIVANVRNAVNTCKQAYLDRQAWVARDNLYQAYKAAAAAGRQAAQEAAGRRRQPGRRASPGRARMPPVNGIRHRGHRPRPGGRGELVSAGRAAQPSMATGPGAPRGS